ncbi:hypothetical protein E4U24_006184 [Claviceps purpurea]|nr:hypothetical protein E4U24_006184 [Claviceps purpurea]KAG6261760.1 hypothetical protein E4U47_008124 [Claviceps purpurea]
MAGPAKELEYEKSAPLCRFTDYTDVFWDICTPVCDRDPSASASLDLTTLDLHFETIATARTL